MSVRPIFQADHRNRELADYPDEFVLLVSNVGHGGREMKRLHETAIKISGTLDEGTKKRIYENETLHELGQVAT